LPLLSGLGAGDHLVDQRRGGEVHVAGLLVMWSVADAVCLACLCAVDPPSRVKSCTACRKEDGLVAPAMLT
jgi:hypothetical protein